MFSPEFAQEYSRLKAYPFHAEDGLQNEVLSQGNKWSERLSDNLISYLSGHPLPELDATDFSNNYRAWLTGPFLRNTTKILESFDTTTPYEEIEHYNNGTISHVLNTFMLDIWNNVIAGNQPSSETIKSAQASLASLCMDVMEPLSTKHHKGELFKWKNVGPANSHYIVRETPDRGAMALATEIDALVAMLEVCKYNTDFITVPAPHQFEHNTQKPYMNVDLLEIDMAHKNIHGIQVKQSMRGIAKEKHYDERFVTVIDGEQDLKNVIYIRKPTGSEPSPVPMPGLYSAHFLANQRKLFRAGSKGRGNMVPGRLPHELMRAKQVARSYSTLAPSANSVATTRMTELALRDLSIYP